MPRWRETTGASDGEDWEAGMLIFPRQRLLKDVGDAFFLIVDNHVVVLFGQNDFSG